MLEAKKFSKNIRRIIAFAFALAIVGLITSLIGCERVQQIVQPTTSQMGGFSGEILMGLSSLSQDDSVRCPLR